MQLLPVIRTEAEPHLLDRGPAISWRHMAAGLYVREHTSGRSYLLDDVGSALLSKAAGPINEDALLNGVGDASRASATLEGMLETGILVRLEEKSARKASRPCCPEGCWCADPSACACDSAVPGTCTREQEACEPEGA